jgi:hypothetical protein
MPWIGFEPTIPVFERAKAVHALDGAATVIGRQLLYLIKLLVKDACSLIGCQLDNDGYCDLLPTDY